MSHVSTPYFSSVDTLCYIWLLSSGVDTLFFRYQHFMLAFCYYSQVSTLYFSGVGTLYFSGVDTLFFKRRHFMQAFGYWSQVSTPVVIIYKKN